MALSWISGYNNINYLNQMIKSVEDTLSNDYNDLDNIPIIKIISSTSNPQNIWELKEGMYLIDGIVYVDNNTSYEVSNLFVSMTARLENGKYVLSAFIPFFKGLYEYILKSNSTEYEEHQIVILATHERMLTRYNETPYEPNGDYNPATKKYVDDKANEIITELDNIGVNKETITSLKEENRIRDIKLQALLSETSDRNISISEDTRYFDMPLSIDNGIVTINEMIGDTLVNVCDQEESVAITKSYTVENENHIVLQGEYDGSCRPVLHGNTLVNHNADWNDSLQTGVVTSASGIEDVQVEGIKGQEVSVIVEGNTVLNHALGKTSAVVSSVEDSLYNNTTELSNNTNVTVLYPNTTQIFKPSTTYTIMYEIKATNSFTVNVPLSMFRLTFRLTDGNYNSGGIYGFTGELTTSYQKVSDTFTTTSNITGAYYIEIRNAFTDSIYNLAENTLYVRNLLILEGDHTTNPKYVNSNEGNYVDLTVANDMSSVVEIEGRTMVNVCNQKDPIAITKSYTVENSGNHIALQGEYDGKCRPVIQGNTMINLFNVSDIYESIGMTINNNNIITLTEENTWAHFGSYIPTLKPSTLYTFVVNVIENTTNDNIYINNAGEGHTYFPEIPWKSVTEVGTYIYAVTTASDLTNLGYSVRTNAKGTGYVKLQIMLFEGDLTQTPELIPTEYVEGLKSSFEDNLVTQAMVDSGEESAENLGKYKVEYKVTGKNKLYKVVQGFFYGSDYIYSDNENEKKFYCGEGLVRKGVTYVTNFGLEELGYAVLLDNNRKFIEEYFITKNNPTITPSQDGYLLLRSQDDIEDIKFDATELQLEEGTVTTEYEPYKEFTKTFYLNSPLLEGDTIEDVNGVATHVRRYNKIDNEYIKDNVVMGTVSSDGLRRNFHIIGVKAINNNSATDGMIANILVDNKDVSNRVMKYTNGLEIVHVVDSSISSVDLYKEHLDSNPLTVVYQLASPKYEPISTESILCDSYVNGHLDFDSAVPVEKVGFRQWWEYVKYLKPNTIYTIQFESDNVGESDFAIGGKSKHVIVTKGLNKVNITTNDIIPTSDLWTEGIGFNASNIVVTEAIDTDFGYFEGLSSTYESCYPGGKNLFDEKWRAGYIGDADGVESSNSSCAITDFISLKSNTTYTIQGYCPRIYMYDGRFNYLGFKQPGAGTLKYQTYTFTTDDKWVYMRLRYIFNSSSVVTNLQELIEGKCQLEEGSTATSYEPFIDKYKVDVKVTGKNKAKEPIYGYVSNQGEMVVSDRQNNCRTDYIEIKSNTNYIASIQSTDSTTWSNTRNYSWFDKNKKFIQRDVVGNTISIISPNNAKYLIVHMVTKSNSYFDVTKVLIQLEEGTVATSYEPYFESTKTFYLNSPLLEGDKIVTKNGKVYHYHKMGRVVLDGSESWAIDSNNVNYIHINYWNNLPHKQQGVILSDKFISSSSSDDVDNKIAMGNNYVVMIKSGKTTSEWVSWLINNPTTVVYELANPYYELIDEYNNTILNIPKNVAHLTHTSAVPVNNTVFTNYKDELNVLEANTQYRVMFDCDKPCSSLNVTLGGTTVSCTSTNISGTKSFLITTPSTLVDKNLVIDGIGRCGIDNIRIFKGNAEYDYVKGLWSGYEERKLVNLMDTSIVSRTGVHTDSIMTKNDNYSKLEIGTCKNTINMILSLYQLNLVNGNIYTLIMDYKTPDSIISPQIGNYSYINMANKRMKTVTNSTNYCDKFLYYDKYVITISQVRQDYPFVEIKNILILEGDWTDNPPTYEEVMANEGKYAVKVKLDTNATIFGKGGRL